MNNFVLDLHVHTPASSDFEGENNDECYIDIIRQAKDQGVTTIAIADHLSVKGYVKIQNIIKETEELYKLIQKNSTLFEQQIDALKEKLEVLKSVNVLMGIELNINPGIHYIIIFSEKVEPVMVEKFLCEIDKSISTMFGKDKHMLEITSLGLFDQLKDHFGDDCFIYAPHSNQNSGVIKDLDGIARENILKDDFLLGLGFNQESDREYISNNILSHIKRKRPLKFLQDSDYHGKPAQKVGSMHFYLSNSDSSDENFNNIREKIINEQNIRTSVDTVKERYNSYIEDITLFKFSSNSTDEINLNGKESDFAKIVCAILNSNTDKYRVEIELKLGDIDEKEKVIERYANMLIEYVKNNCKITIGKISFTHFIISKSKCKVLFNFKCYTRLNVVDGKCYVFDKNNKLIEAKANVIESIVAKKMQQQFGRINDAKMQKVSKECQESIEKVSAFAVLYKILDKVSILEFVKAEKINISKELSYDEKVVLHNGYLNGNTIVLDPLIVGKLMGGRFKNSYFRLLPPYFNLSIDTDYVESNTIIVLEGGGVLFVAEDRKIVSGIGAFKFKNINDKLSTKALCLFLKSSVFQWIIAKNFNKLDLYHWLYIGNDCKLPIFDFLINESCELLDECFDELVNLEKDFLKKQKEFFSEEDGEWMDEINEIVNTHNKMAKKILLKADSFIFEALELDEQDQIQINNDLQRMGIYCLNDNTEE